MPSPVFSRRFWAALLELDRRVVTSMSAYEAAVRRFSVSRRTLSESSQREFHLELCESVAELRAALRELRALERRQGRIAARIESS